MPWQFNLEICEKNTASVKKKKKTKNPKQGNQVVCNYVYNNLIFLFFH